MEFFAFDNQKISQSNSFQLQMPDQRKRPLTILLSWLMSKDSHVKKFVNIYNDLGFDVLKLRISPLDLLRPQTGSQVVAENMLDFLHKNPRHSTILVHGFSVGGYLFCESLNKVEKNMSKHGELMDRFVGQIWDSAVDIYGIPNGVSKAVTNNETLQVYLYKYIEWFINTQKESRRSYEAASNKMHEGFLQVPSLFFMSKSDPVSPPEMNMPVVEKWLQKGIPVYTKVFDNSAHVSHYYKYRKEYETELFTFLQTLQAANNLGKQATG